MGNSRTAVARSGQKQAVRTICVASRRRADVAGRGTPDCDELTHKVPGTRPSALSRAGCESRGAPTVARSDALVQIANPRTRRVTETLRRFALLSRAWLSHAAY